MKATDYTVIVNGESRKLRTEPDRPLLDVLREDLGLTGAKYGCGEGACGACTVIVDGEAVRSCITAMNQLDGAAIETIESLPSGDQLHSVQQAFIDQSAMQCGYCVPGQIMSAVALLREQPHATRAEIVDALQGNICRCCNYSRIRAAVEQAAGVS